MVAADAQRMAQNVRITSLAWRHALGAEGGQPTGGQPRKHCWIGNHPPGPANGSAGASVGRGRSFAGLRAKLRIACGLVRPSIRRRVH
jgi:hypothetical protein